MNILALLVCCVVLLPFNFNPLLSLERAFAQPLYKVRSMFHSGLPTQAKPAKSYTLVMVGDSMTQLLGDWSDLKKYLEKYYPDKRINILNYGIGSTNILSVPDRLTKSSVRGSETLFPILSKDFDVILLESFANNPIDLPLSEGLKKQTETLDQIMQIIRSNKPQAVMVFVATVSPTKKRYAEGVVNLTSDERRQWVEERIAYLKNHLDYAKSHKIPLINIYEKSLNEKGEANIDYINSVDFIHPSVTGIQFISQEIADFIFKNRVLPL